MQSFIAIVLQHVSIKRIYGLIAVLLLITFAGRVSLTCINGGTGSVKSQQLIADDDKEQSDKPEEGKFDSKQLQEFILPACIDTQFLPSTILIFNQSVRLSFYIKAPLIAVITPPPDLIFS